ncbi:Transcription factor gsfR2 [Lachnellula arida]|uniref:Transcription factor gsfR2 n=1 Tax=Lachnellula arida TaxID=1316785 RepID=A0A8T9BER7_9HELO|nr:Transcription factor gsfR2 [Lachnellula arida]
MHIPPKKPNSFVLCREDTPSVESEYSPDRSFQVSAHSSGLHTGGAGDTTLSLGLGLDFPGLSSTLFDNQLASSWFDSVKTWQVLFPTADQGSLSIPDLKRFIARIFRWLAEWVEKGSNPFIHATLYRTRFPRCIQDAYTTLSCYFHKTLSNEQIAFRIIEDRAKDLLAEYGIPLVDPSNNITTSIHLEPFEHVARVHALLVYQILGLYDGDIRLRHLSETYMPVLNSWIQEMVSHASHNTCLGGYVNSSAHEQTLDSFSSSCRSQGESLLWHSWILTESARRTSVVSFGIQAVFLALQQRGGIPCQGGMMVTTRQGVWEAQSSVAWEKMCLEVDVGLMQMAEANRLFTDFAPNDIDEFTKAALEVAFGKERMERWGVQKEEL